jgi:hypothetical protein
MDILASILYMENGMTDPQVKHLFSSIKSDVIYYFSRINTSLTPINQAGNLLPGQILN